MHRQQLGALALLLALAAVAPATAGVETILGKWLAKAETPNGPVEVDIEVKQDGSQLVGTAAMFQGSIPLTNLKFDEPNLSVELALGGTTFRLAGVLKDGKFSGTYEQLGGDMKGPWSMARKPDAAPVATAATGAPPAAGIVGAWAAKSTTPGGDLAYTLELKQEGEKLTGVVSSEMGTMPIKEATLTGAALRWEVDLGGTIYRHDGTVAGDSISGKWIAVGGADTGTWTATRKPAAPAPGPTVVPVGSAGTLLDGAWTSVAVTGGGELTFQVSLKQAGEAVTGTVIGPDGSTVPLLRGRFAANALAFELEFTGSTYRIEATIAADGKLTGKWSAVGGTDSGAWSAQRKP